MGKIIRDLIGQGESMPVIARIIHEVNTLSLNRLSLNTLQPSPPPDADIVLAPSGRQT